MVWKKEREQDTHQIQAIIQEAEAEVKLEIVTTNEMKKKSTERIVLSPKSNQNRSTRSKTEENREKHDQKKRNIFPKGRTTSEKFETIIITTNGNNRKC